MTRSMTQIVCVLKNLLYQTKEKKCLFYSVCEITVTKQSRALVIGYTATAELPRTV